MELFGIRGVKKNGSTYSVVKGASEKAISASCQKGNEAHSSVSGAYSEDPGRRGEHSCIDATVVPESVARRLHHRCQLSIPVLSPKIRAYPIVHSASKKAIPASSGRKGMIHNKCCSNFLDSGIYTKDPGRHGKHSHICTTITPETLAHRRICISCME